MRNVSKKKLKTKFLIGNVLSMNKRMDYGTWGINSTSLNLLDMALLATIFNSLNDSS